MSFAHGRVLARLCARISKWVVSPREMSDSITNKLTLITLQASAVVDRMRRAIATTSDAVSNRLIPISSILGTRFGVEEWYVQLFSEEVVRGGPAFAVSLVLSAVEPALRAAAELGAWQTISPGSVTGRVVTVSGLHEVQDKVSSPSPHKLAERSTGNPSVLLVTGIPSVLLVKELHALQYLPEIS